MFTVIIVEDEPSAMRYLTSLVETRCTGLTIVGKAEDGTAAIELLREKRPDIVITDIQMPSMNGIELCAIIKREMPEAYTVIVSGYSDFDYARGAISSGVIEYLLKPVIPAEFTAVMDKLKTKVEIAHSQMRRQILSNYLADAAPDAWMLKKYWPYHYYWLAVIKSCGIPSRFIHPVSTDNANAELTVIYGRNDLEFCVAYPYSCSMNEFADMLPSVGEYTTALVASKIQPVNFSQIIPMFDALDNQVVVGLSQTLEYPNLLTAINHDCEQTILTRLQYAVSNAMLDDIKRQFVDLFELWEQQNCRLVHVEEILRRSLQSIHDYAPAGHGLTWQDVDTLLTTVCLSSVSFSDLLGQIWQIVEKLMLMKTRRNDSAQIHNKIVDYIRNHVSEPMSTQTICNLFSISPTYLSRLFRKHSQVTFNEFVTLSRVEEAKRLIKLCPEMPIRDIAQKTGFSDQFYFSKVFRSLVGVPPSEYRK